MHHAGTATHIADAACNLRAAFGDWEHHGKFAYKPAAVPHPDWQHGGPVCCMLEL